MSELCSLHFIIIQVRPNITIDNILIPRKWLGKKPHKVGIQQQYKTFVLVHQQLKMVKHRQAKYADKNSDYTDCQVGDPAFLKQ